MRKRTHSVQGVETIILRGIAKQSIFRGNIDKEIFLETVFRFAEQLGVGVMAYALTNNSARIQLEAYESWKIPLFVKKTLISYVQHYFNPKYFRVGSLFQPRYLNETAEQSGGVAEMTRQNIGNCKTDRFASYIQTKKALDNECDTKINVSRLRKVMSNLEYTAFMEECNPLAFRVQAYTPHFGEVRSYLQKAGGGVWFGELPRSDQRTIIANLRKNRITFRVISHLTAISCKLLMRIYYA